MAVKESIGKGESVKIEKNEEPKTVAAQEEKNDDNTLAFVAYVLTWLTGLIVFIIANDKAKNKDYVKFHAMQAILLGITGFIIGFFTLGIGGFLVWLYSLYIGFTYAYKGEKYKVPYIGDYAEQYSK